MTALVGPALLSAAGVVGLVLARELGLWSFGSPGAGLMPAVAGAVLLAASVLDLRGSATERVPMPARRVASYLAALVLLAILTPLVGMVPALAIFVFGMLRFVEHFAMRRAAVIAMSAAAGSWLLFERLLSVPLPKSAFW